MTQAAARSSEPTAARAATMPLASRLRSIQTWEYIIRHVCSHAHTWEHLIRHVHAGDARQLPMNPRGPSCFMGPRPASSHLGAARLQESTPTQLALGLKVSCAQRHRSSTQGTGHQGQRRERRRKDRRERRGCQRKVWNTDGHDDEARRPHESLDS